MNASPVKPLDWRSTNGREWAGDPPLRYTVYSLPWGFAVEMNQTEVPYGTKAHRTMDEAKAAAQADYAARILSALAPAALKQAAEPVAWTQPSQLAILAEFEENGKHTSAEMWNKRDPNVMREFYRVNGCEDEFPDDIPLYASPPCDSRTEALEEAIKLIENRDWPKIAWEETTEDMLENIVSALRALSEAGRSALKEEGE